MNRFPLQLLPGLPIFAENLQQLKESLHKLIDLNVKTIYPAHGKPFSVEIIKNELKKLIKIMRRR